MRLALLLSLLASTALAQGVPIKGGATSDLVGVNTKKALTVTNGESTRQTYIASVSGAVTTAAYNLQVESSAGTGFKVTQICVSYALGATAAGTVITTTVSRRTTASSGGTALTNEGTGTTAVSKTDGVAGISFTGLARGLAATLGTAGATLDQWSFSQVVVNTVATGNVGMYCRTYGLDNGSQPIINPAGTANGIAVNVSAGGAGSLPVGAISMTFIQE